MDFAAGGLGFLAALVLIALRVPVAVAMGLVGAVGAISLAGYDGAVFVLGNLGFEAVFPYGLSVVPLFVFMGAFAAQAGLSKSLYQAVNAFIGHWRGGLAMATIGACAGFGAICGSSLATSATIGRVALPEMRDRGYSDSLAAGSVAAGGTLGVLIPPSIILVIYGLIAEQSIGALFAAALVPGILAVVLYMIAIRLVIWRSPGSSRPAARLSARDRVIALKEVWDVLLLFVVVIGGIYSGLFSPTEAAAVGAGGALALTALKGRLTLDVLRGGLLETALTTGMIFLILIGAAYFNFFIEESGLPRAAATLITDTTPGPLFALFLIVVFYLVLGCFMDSLSMILLTVPTVFPLILSLGYDPIWFGILLVTVVEIGLITPPIGMNLFVISAVAPDIRMIDVWKGATPFVFADLCRIVILIGFPILSLWLPRSLGLM